MIRGRLAPSPTGPQHVGNARTYLLTWLSIRLQGGTLVMRIEDLDSSRVRKGAADQAIDDLQWLGLDWDYGPGGRLSESASSLARPAQTQELASVSQPAATSWIQSERIPVYEHYFRILQQDDRLFPCTCTRKDIEQAASAPNLGDEGPIYPGTCRHRDANDRDAENDSETCWRFRIADRVTAFTDRVVGQQSCDLSRSLGDFIVARKSGEFAYQLAVTVDDYLMGITEVIRGDDLIPSTFRQMEIYDHFGWPHPEFAHVPLVLGNDGRRLAKRHGDIRLQHFRNQRIAPERLVGVLAQSCGLIEHATPLSTTQLLQHCASQPDGFLWRALPRQPFATNDSTWPD